MNENQLFVLASRYLAREISQWEKEKEKKTKSKIGNPISGQTAN